MNYRPSFIDVLWVLIQIALMVIYLIDWPWLNDIIQDILKILGAIPMVVGVVMLIWGVVQLWGNLNIFPSPKPGGKLVTRGIYGSVRHPIYGGILFLAFGYALFEQSFYQIVLALVLFVFFELKAGFEERKLMRQYPGYAEYRLQAGKFFPYAITFFRKKQPEPELEIAERVEDADIVDEDDNP